MNDILAGLGLEKRPPFQLIAPAGLPSMADTTRLLQELLPKILRGYNAGPSSTLSLPVVPQRERVSKRRVAQSRVEEKRLVPSEPITVEFHAEPLIPWP